MIYFLAAQYPKKALKIIINLEGQTVYLEELPFTVLTQVVSTREIWLLHYLRCTFKFIKSISLLHIPESKPQSLKLYLFIYETHFAILLSCNSDMRVNCDIWTCVQQREVFPNRDLVQALSKFKEFSCKGGGGVGGRAQTNSVSNTPGVESLSQTYSEDLWSAQLGWFGGRTFRSGRWHYHRCVRRGTMILLKIKSTI